MGSGMGDKRTGRWFWWGCREGDCGGCCGGGEGTAEQGIRKSRIMIWRGNTRLVRLGALWWSGGGVLWVMSVVVVVRSGGI